MSVVIEITLPDLVIEEGRLQSCSFKGCLSILWNSLKNIRVLSLQKLVKFTSKSSPSWAYWKTCCRLTSSLILSTWVFVDTQFIHKSITVQIFSRFFPKYLLTVLFKIGLGIQVSNTMLPQQPFVLFIFSIFLDYFKHLLLISESKFKFLFEIKNLSY